MKRIFIAGLLSLLLTPAFAQSISTPQGVQGPSSSTLGHIATYSDATGQVLQDGGVVPTSSPCSAFGTTTGTCAQGAVSPFPTPSVKNSLGSNVSLNNTSNYFDGPSAAQGTTGTWFACGQVTVTDTINSSIFYVRLWDGTTIINSAAMNNIGGTLNTVISLCGTLTNPAGNIKISVRDGTATTGTIESNLSGDAKDSTITVNRIN